MTHDLTRAPLGLDAMLPEPVEDTYWAYRYPNGRFWACWCRGWPRSSRKHGHWKVASSDVNDIHAAMRDAEANSSTWLSSNPRYSGEFVQVALEDLGSDVAIIGGWPVVSRWVE